jgi:hypothetical protein
LIGRPSPRNLFHPRRTRNKDKAASQKIESPGQQELLCGKRFIGGAAHFRVQRFEQAHQSALMDAKPRLKRIGEDACRRVNHGPQQYQTHDCDRDDTLARIPDYKITKVDELLPWRWNR